MKNINHACKNIENISQYLRTKYHITQVIMKKKTTCSKTLGDKKVIESDSEDEKPKKVNKKELKKNNQGTSVEWIPWIDDESAWKKINSPHSAYLYKYNKALPNLEVSITDNKINDAKKLAEKQEKISDEGFDDETYYVYKFFKVYVENESVQPVIAYGRYTLESIVNNNLFYLYKNIKCRLTPFADDIKNTKYKLLGCYKAKGEVVKAMNAIKKEFDAEIGADGLYNKPTNKLIFKEYETIIKKIFKTIPKEHFDKLKKRDFYIYKLFSKNNNNNNKIYIFGSFIDINKIKINDVCNNNCLEFGSVKVEIELLEKYSCYFEIEGLLKVDEQIYINKTIDNGMNKYYFCVIDKILSYQKTDIVRIENDMFNEIQRELMLSFLKISEDDYETNGYIVCIEYEKDRYIVGGYKTSLFEKMNELYLKNIKVLSENSFFSLKIFFLEKNIDKEKMETKLLYYKKRFVVGEDKYVKESDMKKESSKIYWAVYNKKKKKN